MIAAFGDSLTRGDGSTPETSSAYVDVLARRLGIPIRNRGISGNRLLCDGYGPSGLSRFAADVLADPDITHVILELGVNDIGLAGVEGTTAPTAETIIEGLGALADQATAAGIVAIGATLTPNRGTRYPGFFSEDGERTRQAVNAWIRNTGCFAAVLDIDLALRDSEHADRIAPAFDYGDGLHPNDAGHQAIAGAFDATVLDATALDEAGREPVLCETPSSFSA
ncbi:GDSL-type esterase/lipase family protein [Catenulispora yoronensis]